MLLLLFITHALINRSSSNDRDNKDDDALDMNISRKKSDVVRDNNRLFFSSLCITSFECSDNFNNNLQLRQCRYLPHISILFPLVAFYILIEVLLLEVMLIADIGDTGKINFAFKLPRSQI